MKLLVENRFAPDLCRTGQYRTGQYRTGQYRTGQYRIGRLGRTGLGYAGFVGLLSLVSLGFALPAQAQSDYMDELQDERYEREGKQYDEKKWRENRAVLPPFPRAENLVPLDAERVGSGYRYFLDAASVRRDSDEVIRYVVILQSPKGASNILYEGIRCSTKELRSYAYGTREGAFRRLRRSQWQNAYTEGPLGYRTLLVEHYICDKDGWPMPVPDILKRLARHDPRAIRWRALTDEETTN